MTYTFETLIEAIHEQLAAANDSIDEMRTANHPTLAVASVDVTMPFDVDLDDDEATGDDAEKARSDRPPESENCDDDIVVVPGRGDGELTVSFRPSTRRVASDTDRPPVEGQPGTPDPGSRIPRGDVSRVEGIGPVARDALRAAGISSLEALAEVDPDRVADAAGVSRERADAFVTAARLQMLGADAQTAELLAARGVDEASLAKLDVAAAVDEIDGALDERLAEVPGEYVPDVRRLDSLIRAARTAKTP